MNEGGFFMSKKNIMTILKGSLISISITIISLLIFSAILAYSNLKEDYITPVIMGILAISVFVGSVISSKKIKEKGILNGAMIGMIYISVIYLLSSLVLKDFSFRFYSVILFILSFITGGIGGIVGVNF